MKDSSFKLERSEQVAMVLGCKVVYGMIPWQLTFVDQHVLHLKLIEVL